MRRLFLFPVSLGVLLLLAALSASPAFGALKLDIWRILEAEVMRARAELEK